MDYKNRIVRELKPDNPRAMQRGTQQLNRYKRELEARTGLKWTTYLDVYRK